MDVHVVYASLDLSRPTDYSCPAHNVRVALRPLIAFRSFVLPSRGPHTPRRPILARFALHDAFMHPPVSASCASLLGNRITAPAFRAIHTTSNRSLISFASFLSAIAFS